MKTTPTEPCTDTQKNDEGTQHPEGFAERDKQLGDMLRDELANQMKLIIQINQQLHSLQVSYKTVLIIIGGKSLHARQLEDNQAKYN